VLVTTQGPIYGREAIEKHYADVFQNVHFSNHIAKPDQYSPHIIGTAGNEMWATGRWSATIQGKHWGPIPANGYWSVIREGDDWKIRMLAFNIAPPPAATPSPTTTPSNQ
ncbi:MAG TPA: hypothetical protein VE860_05005, partial [Chthoniobacterales bacterium]|nr:hypothetical protein [Chthoniobacterales bacterium]